MVINKFNIKKISRNSELINFIKILNKYNKKILGLDKIQFF